MELKNIISNEEGLILLSPANSLGNDGEVNKSWFEDKFPDLANATVPLSAEKYNELKSIDLYWEQNAEKWRNEGLI